MSDFQCLLYVSELSFVMVSELHGYASVTELQILLLSLSYSLVILPNCCFFPIPDFYPMCHANMFDLQCHANVYELQCHANVYELQCHANVSELQNYRSFSSGFRC